MKTLMLILPLILMAFISNVTAKDVNSAEKERLYEACRVALEAKLEPYRQQRIDECVKTKEKKDRASCERYYKDYAKRDVIRNQLFLNIPACVEADSYGKSANKR